MILKITNYRNAIPYIENLLKSERFMSMDFEDRISNLSVATGCPIAAICVFLSELTGSTEELEAKLERIKNFYGYTEVVG